MPNETRYPKMREFIQQVAASIMDDPRTRKVIKEVVLRTLVEQDTQRRSNAVRTFLECCEHRGVTIFSRDGKIVGKNWDNLGADLRAVWLIHKVDIVAYLEQVDHLEKQAKLREEEERKAEERERILPIKKAGEV